MVEIVQQRLLSDQLPRAQSLPPPLVQRQEAAGVQGPVPPGVQGGEEHPVAVRDGAGGHAGCIVGRAAARQACGTEKKRDGRNLKPADGSRSVGQ